jgi:iron complex transport system substrate-binding protein
MRVVSLLPSATEILFALGFDNEIVGVSHECDYPPRAKTKTIVIRSRIPHHASPLEIDTLVREYVSRGESLYAVDADILENLRPDLIITQDLCHVCAASPDDLAAALARFSKPPEVLCLNPQDLGDVWRDILWVAEETGRGPRGKALLQTIGEKLGAVKIAARRVSRRPRVALLEWLQPFYVGGHWITEMIHSAGGDDVLGSARTPSFRVSLEDIVAAAPDFLLLAPCGYDAHQARDEYATLEFPVAWNSIPAVRHNCIYALNANSYFSRPGPRLISGIEALAYLFHTVTEVDAQMQDAFLRVEAPQKAHAAGV